MELKKPLTYEFYTEILQNIEKTYDFARISVIGRSIEGRDIHCLRVGSGARKYLIVGAHHGAEWITGLLALHVFDAACKKYAQNGKKYFEKVTLSVVPLLNPDGVQLATHGVSKDSLLSERQLRMNGGEDFSCWQANARGVDLNRNYNADWARGKALAEEKGVFSCGPTRFGGHFPESEPETYALCRFCEAENFSLAVALHAQGREIYYDFCGCEPKISFPLAMRFAQASGYSVQKPEDVASCAGFKDWFLLKFGKPAFTVECGKGKNPLPVEYLEILTKELTAPLLELPLWANLA